MKKLDIYFLSQNFNGKRFFIFRLVKENTFKDKIKKMCNVEKNEEYLQVILNVLDKINLDNFDNVNIYCMSSYLNKKNEIKNKWMKTKEAKDILDLINKSKTDVKLLRFPKDNKVRNELIDKMKYYNKFTNPIGKGGIKTLPFYNDGSNSIYNKNDKAKKSVDLFLRGCSNYETKEGIYVAILTKDSVSKKIIGECKSASSNKLLLIAFIEAISLLEEPCQINLYTHAYIGLKGTGVANKELKEKVYDLATENNHSVKEMVSNYKQDYLQKLIDEYRNGKNEEC